MLLLLFFIAQDMKVDRVFFYGNKTFSQRELRNIIVTSKGNPYNEFHAVMDKSRILSFYRARGFKDVQIVDWQNEVTKKGTIQCKIQISEGIRIYVKEIKIENAALFPVSKLIRISGIREKTPYDEGAVFTAKYNIANFYAEQGYPYTEVEDSIDYVSLYEFSVTFYIKESQLVRFGSIELEDREGIRSEIVTREITFKKGDIYSPKKIYESQAKIYGTELFRSVKFEISGMETKKDTLDIRFILQRQKPRWIAFGGGYASPDRTYFNMGWGHSDLWGNAQKLELQGEYKVNPFNLKAPQEIKFSAAYLEPYFLNTPLKAQAQPFYEFYKAETSTENYESRIAGLESKIGKYIGRFCQTFISYNYKRIDMKGNIPLQDGVANSCLLAVTWDSRSEMFYPRRGALASLSFELGGGPLGGDYAFNKGILDFTIYSPFYRNSIATRIKIGGILGEIPFSSKFFLGGANTVRGFPDMVYQPDWKNWLCIINMETRIPLVRNFELAFFTDIGNVWETMDEMKNGKFKLGTGIGIRYRTPIGPVRLDYGHGLIPTGIRKGELYFTIGYMF